MAWKKSHKQESRQKILLVAGELFTRKGFNQVGIDEVMQTAGMTRGAFYAHFNSKIDLYEQAIMTAGIVAAQRFNKNKDTKNFASNYLSDEHFLSEGIRCPLASLVSDVAHDDERIREIYTRLFKDFVDGIYKEGEGKTTERGVLLQSVLMIGGMALARSLTDKGLAKEILRLSNKAAQQVHSLTID